MNKGIYYELSKEEFGEMVNGLHALSDVCYEKYPVRAAKALALWRKFSPWVNQLTVKVYHESEEMSWKNV